MNDEGMSSFRCDNRILRILSDLLQVDACTSWSDTYLHALVMHTCPTVMHENMHANILVELAELPNA